MTNPTDPRIEAVARARFNHTRQKVMLERPGVSIVDFDELHEKDKEYWKEGVPEELKAADEAAWLPIESAPKDRTKVLLTDGKEVSQGWYDEWDRTFVRHDEAQAGDGFSVHYVEWEPTLWQPLPKVPKP